MEEDKLIEKQTESLSFIQQLQEQVTTCRRTLSSADTNRGFLNCTRAVEQLETILWPKIKDDKDYREWLVEVKKELEISEKRIIKNYAQDWQRKIPRIKSDYQRAKEQFKRILIFIDKMKYMEVRTNGRS